MSAVILENVTVRYGRLTVLEEIDFPVEEGEIVSIVGPNGGGKTTLLKTILGFLVPTSGKVEIFGKSPREAKKLGWMGYLPQNSERDREFPLRVFDVVAGSRYARKGWRERLETEDKKIIRQSMEKVEILDKQDEWFGALSGGQQQRALIARALALKPRLLVLDEPSTGLDQVAQDSFYALLRDLRDETGLTILLVSHDVGAVSVVVDRVACLNRRMHYHGDPKKGVPQDVREKVFGKGVNFILHDEHCHTCHHREGE